MTTPRRQKNSQTLRMTKGKVYVARIAGRVALQRGLLVKLFAGHRTSRLSINHSLLQRGYKTQLFIFCYPEPASDAGVGRLRQLRAGERQWSEAERANESAKCVQKIESGAAGFGRASRTRPPPGAASRIKAAVAKDLREAISTRPKLIYGTPA